jgi:Zn-dependent protease with chaperone function
MRVYVFDGQSARRQGAELTLTAQELILQLDDGPWKQIPIKAIEVTEFDENVSIQFNDIEIHISRQDYLKLNLKSIVRGKQFSFILKLVATSFVTIFLISTFHMQLIRGLISVVPDSFFASFTDRLVSSFKKEQCLGKEQSEVLLKVFRRLGTDMSSFQVYTIKQSIPNAFAMPPKVIVIHDGLLKTLSSPDALAGILAHEIAHIELEHSKEIFIRQILLNNYSVALDDSYLIKALSYIASNLGSQKIERDADSRAAALLKAKRISHSGMRTFFEGVDKTDIIPALLSTHPQSPDRIKIFNSNDPGEPVISPEAWELLRKGCD